MRDTVVAKPDMCHAHEHSAAAAAATGQPDGGHAAAAVHRRMHPTAVYTSNRR